MMRKSRCHKPSKHSQIVSGYFQRRNAAYIDISLGVPCIMGGLHPNPNTRTAAEQLSHADRNFRRQRLLLLHDVMEVLPRNAEQAGNLDLLLARCRHHVLAQHGAGMSWTAFRIWPGGIFGHFISLDRQYSIG